MPGPMFIHAHSSRDEKKKSICFAVKNNCIHTWKHRAGEKEPHQCPPGEWGYLVVQMPGLVVILGTPAAEERFVIHLDQLPLRTEAEVPKNSEQGRQKKRKSQPDWYFYSANNNSWISAAETNTRCWSLMPENGIQSWIIFSCSYNIPGVFSLFLTLIHSLCRKVFPWP